MFCACLQEQLTIQKFLYKIYCHRHNFTMKGGKRHCYSAMVDSITTFTRRTVTLSSFDWCMHHMLSIFTQHQL